MSPSRKPLLSQAFQTTGVRFLIMGVQFVTHALMARTLGPTARGEYFFIWTVATLVSQFGNLGLQSGQTYLVAHDPKILPGLLANTFWISLVLGGGLGLASSGMIEAMGWAPGSSSTQLLLTAAVAPGILCFLLVSNLAAGLQRLNLFNALQALQACLLLLVLWCVWHWKATATATLAGAAFTYLVCNGWALYRLTHPHGFRILPSRTLLRKGMSISLKAYVVCTLGYITLRAPVFFLRAQSNAADVGQFSVAAQMADVLGVLPQTVALILFPSLIKAHQQDRWRQTWQHLLPVGSIQLAGILITALFAKVLITSVFGSEFLPAAGCLLYLLPGVLCLGLSSVLGQYFAAQAFPGEILGVWSGVTVLAVALSAWLVPRSGLQGAALSYVIPHAVLLGATFWAGQRLQKRPLPLKTQEAT